MKRGTIKTLLMILVTLSVLLGTSSANSVKRMDLEAKGPLFPDGVQEDVIAMPTSNLCLAETYFTVFYRATTGGKVQTIEMLFPAGFDLTNAMLMEVSPNLKGSLTVAGPALEFTFTKPKKIGAERVIRFQLAHIGNNDLPGPQVVEVTTLDSDGAVIDGPTPSHPFQLTEVDSPKIKDESINGDDIGPGAVGISELKSIMVVSVECNGECWESTLAMICLPGYTAIAVDCDNVEQTGIVTVNCGGDNLCSWRGVNGADSLDKYCNDGSGWDAHVYCIMN